MTRSRPLHEIYDNVLGLLKAGITFCLFSVAAAGPLAHPSANEVEVLLQRGEDSVLWRRADEVDPEFNTRLWVSFGPTKSVGLGAYSLRYRL